MKAEIVTVTPALAQDWLEQNKNFRTAKDKTVEILARDIAADKWDLNGESIKFNTKDELIDGQHRLLACIKAKKPFKTLVFYGVKSDLNVDVGNKRQLADYLKHHFDVGGYANTAAGALRVLHGLRNGGTITGTVKGGQATNGRATHQELLRFFQQESDLIESVKMTNCLHGLIQPGIIGALTVLFREKDKELAEKFIQALNGKVQLMNTDPVAQLRERLLVSASSGTTRMTARMKAALTIIAWNHWRKGTAPKYLKFTESGPSAMEFPEVE